MTKTIKDQIKELEEELKDVLCGSSITMKAAKAHLSLLKALESGDVKILPSKANYTMTESGFLEIYFGDSYHGDEKFSKINLNKVYIEMFNAAPDYSLDE